MGTMKLLSGEEGLIYVLSDVHLMIRDKLVSEMCPYVSAIVAHPFFVRFGVC